MKYIILLAHEEKGEACLQAVSQCVSGQQGNAHDTPSRVMEARLMKISR